MSQYPHHVVWGTVDVSGSQSDAGSSGADGSSPESRNPLTLAGHILTGVTFHPESEGSSSLAQASADHSGAKLLSAVDEASGTYRAQQSPAKSMQADDVTANVGANGVGNSLHAPNKAAPSDTDDGNASDDDDVDAGGGDGDSFMKQLVARFEFRDYMVVVAELLQAGGPDAEPFVEFWSTGAERHANGGMCRPCHYNYTEAGCTAGANCDFCHLPHYKQKPRPSKRKRNQHLRFRRNLEKLMDTNPAKVMRALGNVAAVNPRIRAMLPSSGMHAPASASSRGQPKIVMSL